MLKFVRIITAVGLLFLAGCGGGGGNSSGGTGGSGSGGNGGGSNPIPNSATVDFGSSNQTIRGFGGSDAWMPVMPAAEVTALFGTGPNDLGLSILRGRIDPTSNWSTELANAQAAIAASSDVSVIATPWTPPAAMKSNGSTVMGSLNTSSYATYAGYLESYVTYMVNNGVPLYAISMQNEPDANVTYESCVWTPQQMDTWIAQNAGVLTTKLIMPESQSFNTSYSDPALADPSAVGNISIIAGHLYGPTSPSLYANAEKAGKEVWMTEHYLTPAGAQPSIGDALLAAEEIHNSLTVGEYNAYLWWVADWNPGSGVTNYGLVDTNNVPTYYGWALAQFSRFVRPGYVRSNVTGSGSNVLISAYKGNGHYVIVAINMNTATVAQTLTIQNQSVTSMTPYQTTSSATVAAQTAVSVTGNQFTYTLPAQSIVTFVE